MTTSLATRHIGDGSPEIVFCHGLLGRGGNLATIANRLLPTPSLLVDLPNHGRSPWTESFDYLTMADQVADIVAARCPDRATVVGHSLGGKVAMLTALRHPERVSRLCVIDIAPRESDLGKAFGPLIAALRSLDVSDVATRGQADARLAKSIPDPTVRAFLLQNLQRTDGGWGWQPNLALLADSLAGIGGWPNPAAPPFAGPVLWLRGERSDYVRDDDLPTMRSLFPRVRTVTVPGASHWVHADAPGMVASALADLLANPA